MPEITPPNIEHWPEVRRIYDSVDDETRHIPGLSTPLTSENFSGSIRYNTDLIMDQAYGNRPFASSQQWEAKSAREDLIAAGKEVEHPFDTLAASGRHAHDALISGASHADEAETVYLAVTEQARYTAASSITEAAAALHSDLDSATQTDRVMQDRFEGLWSAHKEDLADSQEIIIALSGILESVKTISAAEKETKEKAAEVRKALAKIEPQIIEVRRPTEMLRAALSKILWPNGRYQ